MSATGTAAPDWSEGLDLTAEQLGRIIPMMLGYPDPLGESVPLIWPTSRAVADVVEVQPAEVGRAWRAFAAERSSAGFFTAKARQLSHNLQELDGVGTLEELVDRRSPGASSDLTSLARLAGQIRLIHDVRSARFEVAFRRSGDVLLLASDDDGLGARRIAAAVKLGIEAEGLATGDATSRPDDGINRIVTLAEVEGLGEINFMRLMTLAAAASGSLSLSASGRFYETGLPAGRLVRLATSQLREKFAESLNENDLREFLTLEYPAGSRLPPRPTLDELLITCSPPLRAVVADFVWDAVDHEPIAREASGAEKGVWDNLPRKFGNSRRGVRGAALGKRASSGDGLDSMGLYYKALSPFPLLTKDEEVALARGIEAGELAREELLRHRVYDATSEELGWIAAEGDNAIERLICSNLRLVASIARRYYYSGLDYMDLVQLGSLGLLKAVEKFDYAMGYKFSTYATNWINQSITRGIADTGRTIRLPVHMWEQVRALENEHRLLSSAGRAVTWDALAAKMGASHETVQKLDRVARLPWSLDRLIDDLHLDVVSDEVDDIGEPMDSNELGEIISDILDSLTVREHLIISERFGLNDGQPKTLDEIGSMVGVTRERIRQIEKKTLVKLRHSSRSQDLEGYVDADIRRAAAATAESEDR